ncbi:hypothetical protein SSX86_021548, partial [Deinandra increscens subsp. villosa]
SCSLAKSVYTDFSYNTSNTCRQNTKETCKRPRMHLLWMYRRCLKDLDRALFGTKKVMLSQISMLFEVHYFGTLVEGLVEMVDEFSKQLHRSDKFDEIFLVEEMRVLKEANGIQLPNFLPHYVFLYLLQRRVSSVSDMPMNFVNKVWGYLEGICVKVLIEHCGNHHQLLSSMRKAAQSVMSKMKNTFLKRVGEMIEMERITDYTCDPN